MKTAESGGGREKWIKFGEAFDERRPNRTNASHDVQNEQQKLIRKKIENKND